MSIFFQCPYRTRTDDVRLIRMPLSPQSYEGDGEFALWYSVRVDGYVTGEHPIVL
ncbi:hypothetical protein V22_31820 [Calycomorphotria hydatis]|uniref:Uncharacterized protein n=1 Tax=Calycomorphotria hydatis TaxID=2528027 RepID=A0A517TC26_9PLAN|nr:hypothetical protein V22_31820 [Calycomorphotria hydatis]